MDFYVRGYRVIRSRAPVSFPKDQNLGVGNLGVRQICYQSFVLQLTN